MKKWLPTALAMGLFLLSGCQQKQTQPSATGTLQLRANGEDFVRQGFVSKDGWQISFDHVYVSLSDLTAYQTDPPFDPLSSDADAEIEPIAKVKLDQPVTVDLAEGDATAEPILIGEITAPAGRFNAFSWSMPKATEGSAQGYSLVLIGNGKKEGQSIAFTLKIDQEYDYLCGDYVGDDRKGVLVENGLADLEATFHFDHIFGDGDSPADDSLNTIALGFDPLAALAPTDTVDLNLTELRAKLSSEDYTKLANALTSLGHVGEGHCREQGSA